MGINLGKGSHVPRRTDGVYRAPRRNFAELAQEFGLTVPQLMGHVARSPIPVPKPVIVHRATSTSTKPGHSWYIHAEMRRWWRDYQQYREDHKKAS